MKDPSFLAASFYLNKPARIMTLFMVMIVCSLVYAALEYRIRQALKAHEATSPDQKGKQIRNPTARWVFAILCGHSLAVPGRSMADCAPSHRGTSALAPPPCPALHAVL
jgi:transposase